MKIFARRLFLVGVCLSILWPRYFFLNVAGKGMSGYTLITLVLLVCIVPFLSAFKKNLTAVSRGFSRSLPFLIFIGAFYLWQITVDIIAGATVFSTIQDIIFGALWLVIGAFYLSDEDTRRKLPFVLIFCAFGATLGGLVEFVTQAPLLDVLGLSRFAAIDKAALAAINAASSDTSQLRIKSVFAHPIVYGQTMAMLTPLALHFIITYRDKWRAAGFLLLGCIALSIVICASRSPLIVLVISVVTYLVLLTADVRHPRRIFTFIILLFLGSVLVPSGIDKALEIASGTTARDARSTVIRQKQLRKADYALQYEPITGYGTGSAGKYAGVIGRGGVITVDSQYIVVWVEGGYVGVSLYVLMMIAMMSLGVVITMRLREGRRRSFVAALTAFIAANSIGLLIIAIDDAMTLAFLAVGYFIVYAGHSGSPSRVALPCKRHVAARGAAL